MNVNDIKQQLVDEIAALLDLNSDEIKTNIEMHELGIDSLGLVELFVFIENNFNLKLIDSGIQQEDLKTIDALSERISAEIS